jgi:glycogen operon protein
MTDEDWNAGYVRCLGVRLPGDAIDERNERGERITGETLLLLLNAANNPIPFTLPAHGVHVDWEEVVNTANGLHSGQMYQEGDEYPLQGRSLVVLRLTSERRRRKSDKRRAATRQRELELAVSEMPATETVRGATAALAPAGNPADQTKDG